MRYPFYHLPRPSILPWISDKNLSLLAPVVVYWVVSLTFHLLDILQLPFFEKYRLHEPEEVTKRNRVSVGKVVRMVILQQAVQTVLGILVLEDEEVVIEQVFVDHKQKIRDVGVVLAKSLVSVCGTGTGMKVLSAVGRPLAQWLYWWGIPLVQFVWAL